MEKRITRRRQRRKRNERNVGAGLSQRTVPCPVSLQKQILGNLRQVSSDGLYPRRAAIARKILVELKEKRRRTDPRRIIEDHNVDMPAATMVQPAPTVQATLSVRIRNWLSDVLHRFMPSFLKKLLGLSTRNEKASPGRTSMTEASRIGFVRSSVSR